MNPVPIGEHILLPSLPLEPSFLEAFTEDPSCRNAVGKDGKVDRQSTNIQMNIKGRDTRKYANGLVERIGKRKLKK